MFKSRSIAHPWTGCLRSPSLRLPHARAPYVAQVRARSLMVSAPITNICGHCKFERQLNLIPRTPRSLSLEFSRRSVRGVLALASPQSRCLTYPSASTTAISTAIPAPAPAPIPIPVPAPAPLLAHAPLCSHSMSQVCSRFANFTSLGYTTNCYVRRIEPRTRPPRPPPVTSHIRNYSKCCTMRFHSLFVVQRQNQ